MDEENADPPEESTPEVIKPPLPKRNFDVIKFEKKAKAITAILTRLAWLVVLVIAVFFIYKELSDDRYSIQHINVPLSFEDAGFSGTVVANLLSDKMEEIIRILQENKETAQYINSIDRPDIQVDMVGVGMPVRAFIALIGDAFGIHKVKRISGDIVLDGDTAIFVLRITGQRAERFKAVIQTSRDIAVRKLIDEGSHAILKYTDPWMLGVYYTNVKRDGPSAIKLAKYMMENKSDDPKILKAAYADWAFGLLFEGNIEAAEKKIEEGIRKFPDDSDLYNIWGVVLSEGGKDTEAIEKYRTSLRLFTGKEMTSKRKDQILVNIGVSHAYQSNYDSSLYYFEQALALKKDDWLTIFNISNIYLFKGDTANFYEYFRRAFDMGMEPDFVRTDPDLKRALGEKRVNELIKRFRKD